MKVRYLNSFNCNFNSLSHRYQTKTTHVISELLNFVEKKIHLSGGLGLKKLRKNIWEVRVDIKTRILFELLPGLVVFILVGDHNTIKRYLKNN